MEKHESVSQSGMSTMTTDHRLETGVCLIDT